MNSRRIRRSALRAACDDEQHDAPASGDGAPACALPKDTSIALPAASPLRQALQIATGVETIFERPISNPPRVATIDPAKRVKGRAAADRAHVQGSWVIRYEGGNRLHRLGVDAVPAPASLHLCYPVCMNIIDCNAALVPRSAPLPPSPAP